MDWPGGRFLLAGWTLVVAAAGWSPVAAAGGVEVQRSDERGVVISVAFDRPEVERVSEADGDYHQLSVEGCAWVEAVGEPQVPVKAVRVGIPFGVEPEVRMVSAEDGGTLENLLVMPVPIRHGATDPDGLSRIRHEILPDDEIYGTDAPYPLRTVEAKQVSVLRYQRVLEVYVYPVRWNPVTGRATWISAATFEVSWKRGREEKYRAPAPGEPYWEAFYSRVVANHEDARGWRRAPSLRFKGGAARQEEFKLVVPETGLYRVDFVDLPGIEGPIALTELGVYRKQYTTGSDVPYEEVGVPVLVSDDNGDGFFGVSDRLYFWGLGFRDAFVVNDFEDRYADKNVYWIGWGETGGERMDTTQVWTGVPGDTLRVFPEDLWFEEDRHVWRSPRIMDIDWWYWTSRRASGGTVEFEIYDPAPDSIPRMQIRFQGCDPGAHLVVPTLINGLSRLLQLGGRSFQSSNEYFFDTGDSIPPGFLTDGVNFFQFGQKAFAGDGKAAFGAMLDWIQLRYDRNLVAREDYLHFNTGDLVQGLIRVDGFADATIDLVDVTDPGDPRWVALGPEHVEGTGDSYRLAFPESTTARKEYAAFTPESAKTLPTSPVRRSIGDPCWLREGDYVIVTHEDFEHECERLASHRRGQGFQVQIVRVDELYDAFSGGMKDPYAIKRFLQWGFDHWAVRPQFVVLVGDGSDDHRGLDPDSGPDFVPPVHVMWVEEPLPADNWYVDLDDDYTMDMYLGRLPVGSISELASLIDKMIAYEQFDPADSWRARILAVSDDQCSTLGLGTYRCLAPQEDLFEEACRYSLSRAGESAGALLDTLGLYMSEYTGYNVTEGWHPLCMDGTRLDLTCMRGVVRDSLTPALFDMLNEGVLLFQFQGHGNRAVMSHEYIVVDGVFTGTRYEYDIAERLSNNGRPFIVATFGCHFADFSQAEENSIEWQESLVEKMVLVPEGGAIAGIGPVGYEEYRVARAYQRVLADVMFGDPPSVTVGGDTTGARWLLGELEAAMVLVGGLRQAAYRLVLLGDPALLVDALPPGITVTVDGAPFEEGSFITTGGDSALVQIRAVIGDEVAIDTSAVQVSIQEGGDVTHLSRGVDFSLTVDDSVSGGRVVVVEYPHLVRLADYDIVLEARDRNGRTRDFGLKVRFFSFEVYFDGLRVFDGDYVASDARVEMNVRFPRPVSADDLAVMLTAPGGDWRPSQVAREPLNAEATRWRLGFDLQDRPDAIYTLWLEVGTSEPRQTVRFLVEAALRVQNVTNYPNPFEQGTDFVFQLTAPANVELRVFTVAGKHLATFVTKGENGYNRIYWDGRDNEGDEVANGAYLYRITARGGGQEVRSEIQRAFKMR